LTAHCDDQLEAAHIGDPLRIRQILSNFLSNSVKFTDVGGIELTVRVVGPVGADASKTSAQSLEFMVVDTGIGLTREQQQNLFGEFAQAEPSTTHRFGGTGLGLAICKKLALLMGGDVTMDSSIGHGTTLRLNLELPIGDESQVLPEATFTSTRFAASRPTPTRVEAIREGSLVLAAEDHSVNRAVLLHQLETVGICADTADDGQQALELFISGDYSMVITDVHMPRLDGYGLAEAIRRFEAETGRRRTPIMALTANVMQGEPQRCLDAGMDDFAAKPATIPLLAAKVHEWLPHLEFPRLVADEEVQPVGVSGSHGDCFDHSVLDELTGGDASLAALILRDFVDSTTVDMGRLDEALQAEDAEEVRHQAHRIKGVGSAVGATEVATVAARLESAAPDGDAADLRAMREELSAAFDKVMAELKSDPT
jgi:CheY-like chemotaxis protein/HPt (histidine-containing phosphotransfer) domain-containing protein